MKTSSNSNDLEIFANIINTMIPQTSEQNELDKLRKLHQQNYLSTLEELLYKYGDLKISELVKLLIHDN